MQKNLIDFTKSKGTVNGSKAYMWSVPATDQDSGGYPLIIEGRSFIYSIGFGPDNLSAASLIKDLRTGYSGPTDLPIRIENPQLAPTSSVSSCCNETDSYANSYLACCVSGGISTGNCVWKAEQLRLGNDAFGFSGYGGSRDAYKWMHLVRAYASFTQGGSIPLPGAVVVFTNGLPGSSGLGHVATIDSVNSDGSINVTEQNCYYTCTKSRAISTSTLRSYLAGYIYDWFQRPVPTPKPIATSGETIVDDYNWKDVFNFVAKGPGVPMSYNGGYRMWGTSGTGTWNSWCHFVQTRNPSENSGRWDATIQAPGLYEIRAFISNNAFAATTSVRYRVDGQYSSWINQATSRGTWLKLSNPNRADGYWQLSMGTRSVELFDSDSSTSGQWLVFDAIKFLAVTSNTDVVEIRMSNLDDNGIAYVNGIQRLSAGYYQDTGWVNISQYLQTTNNAIRFRLDNTGGGWTYRFQIRRNGSITFHEECGQVGVTGCQSNNQTVGTRYDQTIYLDGNPVVEIRLSNVDDNAYADVNGTQRASAGYYQDTGFVNISPFLINGSNAIRFRLVNTGGGWTHRFEIRKNGILTFKEECGQVGVTGCNNDGTTGTRYDKTIMVSYP